MNLGILTLNFTIKLPGYPCWLISPFSLMRCFVSLVVKWFSLLTVTRDPSKCWIVFFKPNKDSYNEISIKYTKLLPSLDQLSVGISTTLTSKSDGAPTRL